ncbi:hypothetical protein [Endozoicomonas sp.]|uniref:hypothetical protein n=1 Tax=Endozoicomonas sp. TaxID=1892382 RepID=UPI00383A2042
MMAPGVDAATIQIKLHKQEGKQNNNPEAEYKNSIGCKWNVRSLETKSTDGLAYLSAIGFMYSCGATTFATAFDVANNGIYGAAHVAAAGTVITIGCITAAGVTAGVAAGITTAISAGFGAAIGVTIGGTSCAIIVATAGVTSYCATSLLSYTVAGAASVATPVAITLATSSVAKKAGRYVYDALFKKHQVTLVNTSVSLDQSLSHKHAANSKTHSIIEV